MHRRQEPTVISLSMETEYEYMKLYFYINNYKYEDCKKELC
jgi:hypothetical protein